MRSLARALAVLALLTSCGGASATAGGATTAGGGATYAIALTRHEHVGEVVHFRVLAIDSHGSKVVAGGQVVRENNERTAARAEGTWRTLELDARGRGLHYELTLALAESDDGNGAR